MTTHTAGQERTRRSALVAAEEPRSRTGPRSALDVSIERRPDPGSGGLSEKDAAWPRRLRRLVRASLTHWGRPDLVETAELLVTELATNALRHGSGPDIGVRVSMPSDHLKIEVNDGSPLRPELRHAELYDEGGRGLFIVECLAAEWGVSPDGATTWCTLPLTKGPEEMRPAAVTAPVLREIPMDLPRDLSAPGLARIQARTLLTVAAWPGSQPHAVEVLHTLVDNAVKHALTPGRADQPFGACLSITEARGRRGGGAAPGPRGPAGGPAGAGGGGRGRGA
ncbi:ATP-binding protein, partial [Actinomycetes bacterium NPDC127524]